jgi:hypothetical protein
VRYPQGAGWRSMDQEIKKRKSEGQLLLEGHDVAIIARALCIVLEAASG